MASYGLPIVFLAYRVKSSQSVKLHAIEEVLKVEM